MNDSSIVNHYSTDRDLLISTKLYNKLNTYKKTKLRRTVEDSKENENDNAIGMMHFVEYYPVYSWVFEYMRTCLSIVLRYFGQINNFPVNAEASCVHTNIVTGLHVITDRSSILKSSSCCHTCIFLWFVPFSIPNNLNYIPQHIWACSNIIEWHNTTYTKSAHMNDHWKDCDFWWWLDVLGTSYSFYFFIFHKLFLFQQRKGIKDIIKIDIIIIICHSSLQDAAPFSMNELLDNIDLGT